jgi:transcriptional regulator with PAS, ATPase and Fis domain
MMTVNCGAIPQGILESELFGHTRGAFTGAVETRKGYFELADGSTLFLDEIGEMPLETQVHLLRVLETHEFMPVGGHAVKQVDVRVLAATNKNLERAVHQGEFRKDLFYRLNAVKITVPPLRARREDIRELTEYFSRQICSENNIPIKRFTPEAFRVLEQHSWPGNIRELKNVLKRILIFEKGATIDEIQIRFHLGEQTSESRSLPMVMNKTSEQAERELIYRALMELRLAVEDIRNLIIQNSSHGLQLPWNSQISAEDTEAVSRPQTLRSLEARAVREALERHNGNRRKASQDLGIGERTLYRKIKEYGIDE